AYVLSWLCYSYIPQRETRIAALRTASEHLKPGSRILISSIASNDLLRRLPLALTTLVARLARSAWRLEPTDVILLGTRGIHFEHQFRTDELETEARNAGLGAAFHETEGPRPGGLLEGGLRALTGAPVAEFFGSLNPRRTRAFPKFSSRFIPRNI